MIVGGVSLDIDDSIIAIRMKWRIQLEAADLLTDFSKDQDQREAIAPSGSRPTKQKGTYWSKSIVKWLIQRASPFWNTIRTQGSVMLAVSAWVAGRVWQATGGKVVKFVAKQTLRQMVIRPAVGAAGITAAYFAVVAVLAHDVYVMLEDHPQKTKWLGEGLDLGGGAGGFGA